MCAKNAISWNVCMCVWEREDRELAEKQRQPEQALEPHFLDADHFTRLLHLLNSHPEAIDFTDHFHWYPTKTNYKPIKPFMALRHVYMYYLVWSLQPPFHKCRRTLINLSTPLERNFSLSYSKKKKQLPWEALFVVQSLWKCQKHCLTENI